MKLRALFPIFFYMSAKALDQRTLELVPFLRRGLEDFRAADLKSRLKASFGADIDPDIWLKVVSEPTGLSVVEEDAPLRKLLFEETDHAKDLLWLDYAKSGAFFISDSRPFETAPSSHPAWQAMADYFIHSKDSKTQKTKILKLFHTFLPIEKQQAEKYTKTLLSWHLFYEPRIIQHFVKNKDKESIQIWSNFVYWPLQTLTFHKLVTDFPTNTLLKRLGSYLSQTLETGNDQPEKFLVGVIRELISMDLSNLDDFFLSSTPTLIESIIKNKHLNLFNLSINQISSPLLWTNKDSLAIPEIIHQSLALTHPKLAEMMMCHPKLNYQSTQ